MIQSVLEVGDVPGVRKLQRVKGFEENPFCMWRNGRNVCPGHVEGKDVVVALVPKKIDEHPFPRARANLRLIPISNAKALLQFRQMLSELT